LLDQVAFDHFKGKGREIFFASELIDIVFADSEEVFLEELEVEELVGNSDFSDFMNGVFLVFSLAFESEGSDFDGLLKGIGRDDYFDSEVGDLKRVVLEIIKDDHFLNRVEV